MNSPSLFIPRIFTNISEARIRKILEELNLGVIGRIDLVPRTNEKGETFNRGYVHFKSWNIDQGKVRERLLGGHEIKIIYDDPWFWKVSAYKNMKPEKNKPTRPKVAPHICYEPEDLTNKEISADQYGRDIPRKLSLQEPDEQEESEYQESEVQEESEYQESEEQEEPKKLNQEVNSYHSINIDYGNYCLPKKRKLGRPTKSELVAA
jgi:hypothetical protein